MEQKCKYEIIWGNFLGAILPYAWKAKIKGKVYGAGLNWRGMKLSEVAARGENFWLDMLRASAKKTEKRLKVKMVEAKRRKIRDMLGCF